MEDVEEQHVEQEDTRAEDEYMAEGGLHENLKRHIAEYLKHGALEKRNVRNVLEMLLKDNCDHYWVQHLNDICKYSCVKCGTPQNVDAKTMSIDNHNSTPR